MPKYWIGVVSRAHVKIGEAGSFCQLNHGKAAPVQRLSSGDWLIYYSPRTAYPDGEPVQSFTAIGRIRAGEPYQVTMEGGFTPTRRDVDYVPAKEAPIRPLLDELKFTAGKKSWGMIFRRGVFEITHDDFLMIAEAMNVEPETAI